VILALLLFNLALPVVLVAVRCVSRRGIEINHVFLFCVGYLAYWLAPVVLGELRVFGGETGIGGVGLWYRLYDTVPETTLIEYLVMCPAIFLSFCAGTFLCVRLHPGEGTRVRRFLFDRRLLNVYWGVGLLLALVYGLPLRGQFFKGYTAEEAFTTDYGTRGTFTAISVFLLSLAILFTFKRREQNPAISFRASVMHHFLLSYLVVGGLVLSLGGRLYFLSAIIALLVYRSVYFRPIPARGFLLSLLVGLCLLGVVGTLRMGVGVTGDAIFLSLVSEPLFNSFSLLQYLSDGRFDWIRPPVFLLGDLVNLVPSALLPNKAALLPNPTDYGYTVYSPLGALNSFFSFMINFGLLGTMLVMGLIGFFLQRLRSRATNVLSKTIYVLVCGWLPTSFFRDPFSISLVKVIFQFSILLPTLLTCLASLVTVALVGTSRLRERSKGEEM